MLCPCTHHVVCTFAVNITHLFLYLGVSFFLSHTQTHTFCFISFSGYCCIKANYLWWALVTIDNVVESDSIGLRYRFVLKKTFCIYPAHSYSSYHLYYILFVALIIFVTTSLFGCFAYLHDVLAKIIPLVYHSTSRFQTRVFFVLFFLNNLVNFLEFLSLFI